MMKIILVFALWCSATLASNIGDGISLRSPSSVEEDDLPDVEMEWEGPVFPGGPDVTLYGTAQSIYAQVRELNPNYDQWEFPDYAAEMEHLGITKEDFNETHLSSHIQGELESRQFISFTCSINHPYVWAFARDCSEGVDYLRSLGNSMCGAPTGGCARVSCSNGCGMYLCNLGGSNHRVRCRSIADDMIALADRCGQTIESGSGIGYTRVHGRRNFVTHWTRLNGGANC